MFGFDLSVSGGIFACVYVDDRTNRLDKRILILTLPHYIASENAAADAVDGVSVIYGIVVVKNVNQHIHGVADNFVYVEAMEMILQVGQTEYAHAERVDDHVIFGSGYVEEATVYGVSKKSLFFPSFFLTHIKPGASGNDTEKPPRNFEGYGVVC